MVNNTVKSASKGGEERSPANYVLQTDWWTPAAVAQVWDALADYAAWPTWWRGIRSVEVLRRGDESGAGTVLRQQWRSKLPYTLHARRQREIDKSRSREPDSQVHCIDCGRSPSQIGGEAGDRSQISASERLSTRDKVPDQMVS